MTVIDDPQPTVQRDRWGRPLVVPPGGGKPVAYTRCTTFVDCLDDKYNLQQWQQRMVAMGIADRPDLLLAVSAHRDDKKELNSLTKQALDAAAAGAAATTGTAIHALTERVDRGEPLPLLPPSSEGDLEAYRRATAPLDVAGIETFLVNDRYRIAGTADRLFRYDGQLVVGDIKTGSIDYGAMKIAMQLAVYAHSDPYDVATGRRRPHSEPVATDRALVVHLPAGTGTCELRWIDITAGWEAVDTAATVRQWRKRKDWFSPFEVGEADPAPAAEPTWRAKIAAAPTVDAVRALYAEAVTSGVDGEVLLQACLARKAELDTRR